MARWSRPSSDYPGHISRREFAARAGVSARTLDTALESELAPATNPDGTIDACHIAALKYLAKRPFPPSEEPPEIDGAGYVYAACVYGQVDGSVVTEESETRPDRETSQLLCEAEAIARDAGAVVLPARGYHETRVDDIVATAGVSHGSFYRYFSSKDDFFHVLAEGASTRMIELIDAYPGAAEPVALRSWLEEWFDAYESNGGVISTWQEMQTSDPRLRAFSRQIAATVLDRLTTILAPRGFGDPLVDALTLLAVIERLPYSVYTLHHAARDEAVDAMAVIIRRGLMGLP